MAESPTVFERYVDALDPLRELVDDVYIAGIHKRLGELYEAKGDWQQAMSHYSKFVELWKNVDGPLQPKVAEVRAKLARLSKIEGK